MVKEFVFAVPGDLATPTGGYAYDRRMIAELAALGWRAQVLDLGDGFPRPTNAIRAAACKRLERIPAGTTIVIDGLAFGVLPEAAEVLHASHPLVALVHHPLALETGLDAEETAALRQSETAALAHACRTIATSAAIGNLLLAEFGVAKERLAVAPPGTDRAPIVPRAADGPVHLLAVGAIVPRKGYDVLLAALTRLMFLPWQLVIVGDRTRNPDTARRIDTDIARYGLADRVQMTGAIADEELAALYASADLFVLPSRFEGYGMAYTEAIAHGVPVVGTTAGAIPQTVPAGVGVLVHPDDIDALTKVLRRLIEFPHERRALAAAARAAAATLPTWRDAAGIFAKVLEEVV